MTRSALGPNKISVAALLIEVYGRSRAGEGRSGRGLVVMQARHDGGWD